MFKKPRNIYLLAVLTVVLLVIAIQVITQYSLGTLEQRGRLIVLTEHQGMMSQEIAKLALEMKEEPHEKTIDEMREVYREWTETYQRLRLASEAIHMSTVHQETIQTLMRNIRPAHDSIATAIIALMDAASPADRLQPIRTIQHQEDAYSLLIDALVVGWRSIAVERVKQMRMVEILLAIFSLIIVGFELFFIFLPAFRKLKEKNKALQGAYQEQEALNDELVAIQEELQQSLNYQTAISRNLEEAKQKAEASSKAKEEFLSTMSHEIRTPMNAVIGLTCLLLENDPKPLQVENLQALKFSGDSLLSLINDILDYSKIEAGKIELEKTRFSLNPLFKGIKQSLGVNASEKEIDLYVHLSDEIPEVLLGDPTRLSQVLNNLVGNAIKFTLQGEVILKAVIAHKTEEEVGITFTVQDTGIGIPEDKLEAIFQSFTQVSSDTTRKYGGTGLGLSISKKLLEIQHSQLKVSSKVNEGTIFTFTLVFQYIKGETFQQKHSHQGQQALGLKGVRVLVAEDNQMNVIVIQQFLKKWGIECHIVPNGRLAVEAVGNEQFDLVLMDLQMPEMDGFTATRAIRKFNKNIPILALTASASVEVQQEVYAAQMNDYATKPFIPAELYAKIEKYKAGLALSEK